MKNLFLLAEATQQSGIQKLEGGTYDINSIIEVIGTLTDWVTRIGIAAAGLSLVIGFVMYSVVDVEKKAQVKHGIILTLLGIAGIITALSLVNLIIESFTILEWSMILKA